MSLIHFSRIALSAVRHETYPVRGLFAISRGSKRRVEVVVAELAGTLPDGRTVHGWGECVPYAHYGESVDVTIAAIEAMGPAIAAGMDRLALQSAMPPGAARNALDCAFWDLEAKGSGLPVWQLAGLTASPRPLTTAYTLSWDTPEAMGKAARAAVGMPLLKLKLGGGHDDAARVAEVRRNAPNARLIVDANEAWTMDQLIVLAPVLADAGVSLIEQPLPAGKDDALASFRSPVPLGADESCHDINSLPGLANRYQVVNIKLDKTGGLTGALKLKAAAEAAGLKIMVGCMVSTSLSMAPAFLVAQGADFVDLDGPLLLERDREPGLAYSGATVAPPLPVLWG